LHTPRRLLVPAYPFPGILQRITSTVIRARLRVSSTPLITRRFPAWWRCRQRQCRAPSPIHSLPFSARLTGNPAHPANPSGRFPDLILRGSHGTHAEQHHRLRHPHCGQYSCLTPALISAVWADGGEYGPPAPGTVTVCGHNNYKSPMSQQVLARHRARDWRGFSVSANYVYVHTTHLPVAIDTTFCRALVRFSTGVERSSPRMVFPSRTGERPPASHSRPVLCRPHPHHTQKMLYSSLATALYQVAIFELKNRFSNTSW